METMTTELKSPAKKTILDDIEGSGTTSNEDDKFEKTDKTDKCQSENSVIIEVSDTIFETTGTCNIKQENDIEGSGIPESRKDFQESSKYIPTILSEIPTCTPQLENTSTCTCNCSNQPLFKNNKMDNTILDAINLNELKKGKCNQTRHLFAMETDNAHFTVDKSQAENNDNFSHSEDQNLTPTILDSIQFQSCSGDTGKYNNKCTFVDNIQPVDDTNDRNKIDGPIVHKHVPQTLMDVDGRSILGPPSGRNKILSKIQNLKNEPSILDICEVKTVMTSECIDMEIDIFETNSDNCATKNTESTCTPDQTILDHASCCSFDTDQNGHLVNSTSDIVMCSSNRKNDHVSCAKLIDAKPNFCMEMTLTCPHDKEECTSRSLIESMNNLGEPCSLNRFKEVEKVKVKSDAYDIDDDTDECIFTHNASFRTFKSSQIKRDSGPKTQDQGDALMASKEVDQCKVSTLSSKNYSVSGIVTKDKSIMSENLLKSNDVNITVKTIKKVDDKDKCKVVYIYSEELVMICDQMQKIPNRASMVHSLIEAFGMLRYLRIVEPRKATDDEVKMFHDPDYIEFLKKISDQEDIEKFENDATQYGLSYDCPLHHGLYDYAIMTAGATIVAAECLLQESCRVAINWCGGWHHAAKDQASGFCYINDIVLGILKLKEKYGRILYVDLDLHHGDGVENAFSATSKVLTVSFHKYASGFFPGTGSVTDIGIGKGQYYTVNVPLLDGVRDAEFTPLVCRILNKVKEVFHPEAVVCQCGADGLAGDPMESFNLTHKGLGKCVYFLLQWNLPTLILGGGGYNLSNTARCWAFLTALAAGKQLPVDIPDHQYFMEYGPDYDLDVQPGNRKNDNTAHYLRQVYGTVMSNLRKIQPVCSDR